MQLASGCMWIWFADSIPTLVGFLRALQFPPTPKNRNPFIFLVHSFWSLVVCIKPACLPEVELPMCALRLSHHGALRTQWVDMSRVTKSANLLTTASMKVNGLWHEPILKLSVIGTSKRKVVGYEQNTSFLLIPKSLKKFEKKLTKSDQAHII